MLKVFEKIKNGLKKRKVKIFLVFLLCSALIWFINNLSRSYVSNVVFDFDYINVPEGYLFESATMNAVDVRLRGGGFQFLRFNFLSKKVVIDLSELEQKENTFFASPTTYRRQIESQLPGSMSLLEIENDTLFFDLLAITSKKVPVNAKVYLNLAQNYLLDGQIKITPDSITVTGPAEEIDSIRNLRTERIELPDVASNFSKNAELLIPKGLENTSYSEMTVTLNGEIARFSEKIFEIPIKPINFPEGVEVKMFPEKVSVLCKAKLEQLKNLDISDFQVVADYKNLDNDNSKEIVLNLQKKPEGLPNIKLMQKKAEYILKKSK